MLTEIKLKPGESEKLLWKIAEKKLPGCKYVKILKKSLDARNKSEIRWVYQIQAEKTAPQEARRSYPQVKGMHGRVVIVGSGPAGLFCAIRLIRSGILPIVVERGGSVEERAKQNANFFSGAALDENCNVQFGEGGAGTFSDGKLNTQTKDPRNREVLETFVEFGAPQEILYLNKPHIGSDRLRGVVAAMRNFIIRSGGEVRFHTLFKDIVSNDGQVKAVLLQDLTNGQDYELDAEAVVLAIGHSSRDTFLSMKNRGLAMEPREFAVGVRIEHLQEKINFAQYSDTHKLLPPADYKMVSHAGERSAFTFCMCPGGVVIPAASEEGGVVTNGMSDYARDGLNANSALLVQIRRSDFNDSDVLGGVEFQRMIEKKAFELGGGNYKAPAQRVEDFLNDRETKSFGEVMPTYAIGVEGSQLKKLFPDYVSDTLKRAILDMDRRLKGFADPDAVLTAAETRFSSPVRILRGSDGQSVNFAGVFPCGEGCGYSGGITSSAADGIRIAECICEKYI